MRPLPPGWMTGRGLRMALGPHGSRRSVGPRAGRLASVFSLCLLLLPAATRAATRYVDARNPAPLPPFTQWAHAARTIQDAVDVATAGDEIVVTNGLYATGGRPVENGVMTNRVAIDKAVTVRSVNGPLVTLIEGAPAPGSTNGLGEGAIRCVFLANGASLDGFTLTNGHTRRAGDFGMEQCGGGVRCSSTNVLTNCILVGNAAGSGGGLAFGTNRNCTITGNHALWDGGGAWYATLEGCVVSNNTAGVSGGGTALCKLTHGVVRANAAPDCPDVCDPTEAGANLGPASLPHRAILPSPSFQVRSWHVEDGLPCVTITALAQTEDGYLWLGTREGLVRYDGARFVRLDGLGTHNPTDSDIAGLLVARDGSLWIAAASDRVCQLTRGQLRPRFQPAVPGGMGERWYALSPLAQDGEGTLWALAGTNQFLLRFVGDDPPSQVALDELPPGPAKGVWGDREGNLWLAKGLHICRYHQGRWTSFLLGCDPSKAGRSLGGAAPTACLGREGGIWFTYPGEWSKSYLRRRTAEGWAGPPVFFAPEGGGARTAASIVLEDSDGRLWGNHWWGSLRVRTASRTWERLQEHGVLASCIPTCTLQDRQGGVWMGTIGEGLFQAREQPVIAVATPGAYPGQERLNAVCAARDGSLWLGTAGAGLHRWAAGSLTQLPLPGPSIVNGITTLFEDAHTNLWVATSAGLLRQQEARFVHVAEVPVVVFAMINDCAGRLWAGGMDGLGRWEGGTNWTWVAPADGSRHVRVRGLAEDRAGQIWVVSEDNVWRVQGDRLLPAEWWQGNGGACSILADAEGVLWVGTGIGLFRWDGRSRKHYRTEDGLPDNGIASLTPDDAGNLWIGSNNGIFGCPRRSLAEYERGRSPLLLCWRLGTADGLASRVCNSGNQAVASRGPDGRIWVRNQGVAAGFDPVAVSRGHPPAAPLFESLTADDLELAPVRGEFSTRTSIRRFAFRYTVPELAAPETMRFRHRLEPLDAGWIDAGRSRVAEYSKLAPGDYRFRLMVGGSDGQWHEGDWAIPLRVIPRFWERPGVRIGAGVLVAGVLVAGVAWRRQRELQRRLERLEMQQAVELERTRIARDLHDHLGASLTEIVLMSDPENHPAGPVDGDRSQLQRVSKKARAMGLALHETVWAVNPRNDNLPRLLDYLCSFSEELCEAAGVRCWQDVPTGVANLPLSVSFRHGVVMAVREVLNNALKHSGTKELWLRLTIESDRLAIAIADQGRGFEVGRVGRNGNGLGNLRERMTALGGRAELDSAPGRGTTVRLTVPLLGE